MTGIISAVTGKFRSDNGRHNVQIYFEAWIKAIHITKFKSITGSIMIYEFSSITHVQMSVTYKNIRVQNTR
jgi:hypothetical protein